MKLIRINPDHPEAELVDQAAQAILAGQVIAYPTETVYGLGANALNAASVQRVFELKDRDRSRPILVIAGNMEQVRQLVVLSELAERLARLFWPGPLTLVLPARLGVPCHLLSADGYLGVRVPGHKFCLELLNRCGVPITSSSANLSGQPNPVSVEDVVANFDDRLELIIDGGYARSKAASTVVQIRDNEIVLLRAGVISELELERQIGKQIHERSG
ncbi:MAG: L-threonylcarbamoyladenylate synthase [candidate division KSB1 bacterium]|nr:L-threonylcarbamoyladenylate synthase [candidate division KSB1 bacterium]